MKSTNSRIASLAIIGAVIMAVPLLSAAPASAAAPAGCINGYACFWADTSYLTGGHAANDFTFFEYVPNYAQTGQNYLNTGQNINDTLTSAYNYGTSTTGWWSDANGSGDSGPEFYLTKSTGDGNVSNNTGYVQGAQNDSVSASYFAAYEPN